MEAIFFIIFPIILIQVALADRRGQADRLFRALELADVDHRHPKEFEQFVGKLMERRGYTTRLVGKAGDMGVDVVAEKGDSNTRCR